MYKNKPKLSEIIFRTFNVYKMAVDIKRAKLQLIYVMHETDGLTSVFNIPCTSVWWVGSESPVGRSLPRCVLDSLWVSPGLRPLDQILTWSLVLVQVWKYPKVWEGFVKCCQRTKPQSYSVLLQLPPTQLNSVFERCPEMREPLLQHVLSFTPLQVNGSTVHRCSVFKATTRGFNLCFSAQQQAHIPASIMVVLESQRKLQVKPAEPEVEKQVSSQTQSQSVCVYSVCVCVFSVYLCVFSSRWNQWLLQPSLCLRPPHFLLQS